jgi:hypothetical protein
VTVLDIGVLTMGALDVLAGDGGWLTGFREETRVVPSACNIGAVSERRHRKSLPKALTGVACGVCFGVGLGVGIGVAAVVDPGELVTLSFKTCAGRVVDNLSDGKDPGSTGTAAQFDVTPLVDNLRGVCAHGGVGTSALGVPVDSASSAADSITGLMSLLNVAGAMIAAD